MSSDEHELGQSVKLNNNSYISIGIVVLIVAATLWIKDGQSESARMITAQATDLSHYKELQTLEAKVLQGKIDNLAQIVKAGTDDRWTAHDAKSVWKQFKALNPQLRIPDIVN